jgi:Protein of unknown function (DUF1214)
VEDLAQYRQWSERLHDLGECEVKHGLKLLLANLFGEDFGNAALPARLAGGMARQKKKARKLQAGLALAAILLLAAGIILFRFKSGAKSSRTMLAEAPPKSIAVLPFDNLSRSMLDTPQRFPRAGSQGFPSPAAEASADGSTTIYFSPKQPDGVKRGNWIQTDPNKGWFTILRLYSPLEPFFTKASRPSEVELMK